MSGVGHERIAWWPSDLAPSHRSLSCTDPLGYDDGGVGISLSTNTRLEQWVPPAIEDYMSLLWKWTPTLGQRSSFMSRRGLASWHELSNCPGFNLHIATTEALCASLIFWLYF